MNITEATDRLIQASREALPNLDVPHRTRLADAVQVLKETRRLDVEQAIAGAREAVEKTIEELSVR
jgi:hypothetical protein